MGKRILFITHQLSKTGAPIVLLDMIRFCKKRGDEILVMSMAEGELRDNLEKMGISVIVREHFLNDYLVFLKEVEAFDYVVANTLITFEAVHVLKYGNVPVYWWLHEGKQYFEYFAEVLPDFCSLPPHIQVYSVSGYVQDALRELYGYETHLFPVGVEDVYQPVKKHNAKLKFIVSGTYSKLKGQDILCDAVRQLPSEFRDRFQLEFYGDLTMRDEEVYRAVYKLAEQYSNILIMPFVSHEEMLKKIAQADCLIIPSRVDPLPTVAIEAMMEHVPCICSDVCGIARQMDDGKNGLLFHSGDVRDLIEKIEYALEYPEILQYLGEKARRIYEKYYSYEVFERNVESLFKGGIL